MNGGIDSSATRGRAPTPRSELSSPWHMAVLALLLMTQAVTIGLIMYSFSLWVEPWRQEYGVGRADVMLAIGGFSLGQGVLAIMLGRFLDNFSERIVLSLGISLFAAGFFLLAYAPGLPLIILIYATLLPMGTILCGPLATAVIIVRYFEKRRGLAMGLATLGTSLGGVVFPLLSAGLIAEQGWRAANMVLAIGSWLVLIPLIWLVFGRGKHHHRRTARAPLAPSLSFGGEASDFAENFEPLQGVKPDPKRNIKPITKPGPKPPAAMAAPELDRAKGRLWGRLWGRAPEGSAEAPQSHRRSWRDFFADTHFWILSIAFSSVWMAFTATQHNVRPFAVDRGFSLDETGVFISSFAASMVLGKLLIGFLSDHLDYRLLFSIGAVLLGCALFALSLELGFAGILGIFMVAGFAAGFFMPLQGLYYAAVYGPDQVGQVLGLARILAIMAALGPIMAGEIRDRTGSYDLVFLASLILLCVVALLIWRVAPRARVISES